MRSVFLFLYMIYFAQVSGQSKLNMGLKNELDSIYQTHSMFVNLSNDFSDVRKVDSMLKATHLQKADELVAYLVKKQQGYDSLNVRRIKAIIREYGYPGFSLVGSPTDEVAFYVLQKYLNQHKEEFTQYLPILKKAAEAKELPLNLYAWMIDRDLMNQKKEQLYGTQITTIVFPTGGGLKGIKWIVWPIKDPATVNDRRKKIGLSDTVEEEANRLMFVYQVYTLDEIKKMEGQ